MSKIGQYILNGCFIIVLAGCFVYKAGANEGISVLDIKQCQTQNCFLSHGMEVLDRHQEENGKYIEIYRAIARKTGLNYVRACAGYGVLDIATLLGLWEAGTPVEGAISNNRGYITPKVAYSGRNVDRFEKVEIYDANGKKAYISD